MGNMTIDQKRAILDKANGRVFQVTFVKGDGTIRTMNTKKWAEKAFTRGSSLASPNTVAHKPQYYTAVDMDVYKVNPKKSFRNINLETLISAKINGVEYKFD